MHACLLDVFHDATDQHLAGVIADRIDVDLGGVGEEPVDQHRPLGGQATLPAQAAEAGQFVHGARQVVAVVHNLHGASPEHVTRPNQHRETDVVGDGQRLFEVDCGAARGLRDAQLVADRVPAFAILRCVDRIGRCADDQLDGDQPGQLQRCLSAERHDDGFGLFGGDDVEDVLLRQRFEVQAIGRVVIGRHGLGIAVDHDRLEACFAQGERCMDTAVVELDALADPVGARPEDDDLTAGGRADFALVLVGGIVIRRLGDELGRTGVDGLVRRNDARCLSCGADFVLGPLPQVGELAIGESETLGAPPVPFRHGAEARRRQLRALFHDHRHLVEEPRIDARRRIDRVDRGTPFQQFADLLDPIGRRNRCLSEQVLVGQLVEMPRSRIATEPEAALLQRPQRLLQAFGERSTDGHDLTDGLHLGAEHAGGARQFLERPARDLGDDVVDDRLEARRRGTFGGLGDVVGDLVEGVADGEPGGDLGDREPGRLRGES